MRILVTYAVQGEFTELKFPGLIGEEEVQVGYLRTGIGKVKSAFYLAEAISSAQPDLVVNVGTAGTVRHQVGDILVCRHFIDRDMQRLTGFDMECEIDSSELLEQKGYCLHWQGEGVCNTGDTFLTELSDVGPPPSHALGVVKRTLENRSQNVRTAFRRETVHHKSGRTARHRGDASSSEL